jgi:Xaa-Pro dipeptidase
VNLFQRFDAVLGGEVADASPLIRAVRSVKSAWEVERIRAAARVSDRVFARAREVIEPGMTDLELAAEIEHEARRHGHQGLVRLRAFNAEIFYGHIFSGPDAAVPGAGDMPLAGAGLTPAVGQGSGRREIRQGDPIIVDIATCIEGYMCDQSRTFCVGTLPEPLASAYGHMVAVEDRMMALARPGASQGALHEECCEVAARFGHRDRFMGPPGAQVGFIGHGVGIELDEPPFIARGFGDSLLEEGMVFAFEPKAVFPGKGAVGIEDTFLVTAGGVERLTVTGRELVEL